MAHFHPKSQSTTFLTGQPHSEIQANPWFENDHAMQRLNNFHHTIFFNAQITTLQWNPDTGTQSHNDSWFFLSQETCNSRATIPRNWHRFPVTDANIMCWSGWQSPILRQKTVVCRCHSGQWTGSGFAWSLKVIECLGWWWWSRASCLWMSVLTY